MQDILSSLDGDGTAADSSIGYDIDQDDDAFSCSHEEIARGKWWETMDEQAKVSMLSNIGPPPSLSRQVATRLRPRPTTSSRGLTLQ